MNLKEVDDGGRWNIVDNTYNLILWNITKYKCYLRIVKRESMKFIYYNVIVKIPKNSKLLTHDLL